MLAPVKKFRRFAIPVVLGAVAALFAISLLERPAVVGEPDSPGGSAVPPPPPDPQFAPDKGGASLLIDANKVKYPVVKGNFGGKIMKETRHSVLMRALPDLQKLTPGFLIYTIDDGEKSKYRWDLHQPLEGGYEAREVAWSIFQNVMAVKKDGDNEVNIDYWQATDLRHSAFVVKKDGDPRAAMVYLLRDKDGKNISRSDIDFVRFDMKIDVETPFVSPPGDEWELCSASGTGWKPLFRVWLTQERRLRVTFYTDEGSVDAPLSRPLSIGEWHSIELRYDLNSGDATVGYFIDGAGAGISQHRHTQSKLCKDITTVTLGALGGSRAAGRIHFDALRLSGGYIGKNPGPLGEYPFGTDFDNNAITIDDFLAAARRTAGFTPIIQVPMFPPGDDLGRDEISTPQWSADLVEYVNGKADADYIKKAASLDFTHKTPADNWANLRAARGRVEPYNVKYWQMGSEPYWAEDWPKKTPQLYADACAAHIKAMKAVDPSIKCAVHLYPGYRWSETVLAATRDLLDMVCLYHDYACEPGLSPSSQLPRLLGIPAAATKDGGVPYVNRHAEARALIQRYLANRADRDKIPTIMDEHGFMVVYPQGTGDDLAYGLFRIAYRMETIEHGGPNAWDGDWLVLSDYKFTYGVIGSGELTPSYWAYRLFYEHFRDRYLATVVDSPTYTIFDKHLKPILVAPYVSCYASKSSADGSLSIIVINRHTKNTIPVDVALLNFVIRDPVATVYTLGGGDAKPFDDNGTDPNHVVPRKSEIKVSADGFTLQAEPLSLSVIILHPR